MILINSNAKDHLSSYGIEIPLLKDRAESIVHFLENDGSVGDIFREKRILWEPTTLDEHLLKTTHTPDFIQQLKDPEGRKKAILDCYELLDDRGQPYRYDPSAAKLPLSYLVTAQLEEAAGTIAATKHALAHGFCYYLGGGMHHAMPDTGRGFCLVNDVVMAARFAQAIRRGSVWVIDVDAHKGDGTAVCTQGDKSINTLSIHMAQGWPLDEGPTLPNGKANIGHTPSDIDIPVQAGEEHLYNQKLEDGINQLQKISKPQFAIVVNGSDPFEHDALPSTDSMKLSEQQLLERDMLVYQRLNTLNVPQVWVMAGGYGKEVWRIHAQLLKQVLLLHTS